MMTATEMPHDDDSLADWLETMTGYAISRRASCPDHDAPFQWIADVFFGRANRVAVLGPRGGGKTLGSALLHWATGSTATDYEIAHFGGSMQQALQCQGYIKAIASQDGISASLKEDPRATWVKWSKGSTLTIHTATEKQASGGHPNRKQADEFDLWQWAVWQKFLGMGMSEGEEGIQTIYTSTRSRRYGMMHNLLAEAHRRDIKVYRYCIWDVKAPCRECLKGSCPLWDWCEGKHQKSEGHMPRAVIIDKALQMDGDTIRTELFCEEPSAVGLCWPDFDPIARDEGSNVSVKAEYNPEWPVFWGADDNYEEPACIGLWQEDPHTGFLHCFDEYYQAHRLPGERINDILEDTTRWPYRRPEFCIPDATAVELIGALHREGIPTFAPKGYKRVEGVKIVRRWIRDARGRRMLLIHPRCVNVIRSIGKHHYKDMPAGPDGKARFSDEPEKHSDDHGADMASYVCWVRR
jgi:hypothetical protein